MSESNREFVTFEGLYDFFNIRPKPITHQMIADKTIDYGRNFDRTMVTMFLLGKLNPKKAGFTVIRRTIEGEYNITIDFIESPYEI